MSGGRAADQLIAGRWSPAPRAASPRRALTNPRPARRSTLVAEFNGEACPSVAASAAAANAAAPDAVKNNNYTRPEGAPA